MSIPRASLAHGMSHSTFQCFRPENQLLSCRSPRKTVYFFRPGSEFLPLLCPRATLLFSRVGYFKPKKSPAGHQQTLGYNALCFTFFAASIPSQQSSL
ncbi:MAG TPA: hypothetical protein VE994_16140, partial [Terriglobales bacterium]|nr:hypothetical protein [Terriglobales bacterium]